MKIESHSMQSKLIFEDNETSLREALYEEFEANVSVYEEGYMFSPAYKHGHWDGKVHFVDKKTDTFPTGLLPYVLTAIGNVQSAIPFQYEVEYSVPDKFIEVEDMSKDIVLKDKGIGEITLRDYQYNAVKSIVDNDIGIINVATNGGKCLGLDTKLLTTKGITDFGTLFAKFGIDPNQEETTIENTFDIELINRYGKAERPSHITVNGTRHVNKVTTEKGWEEILTDNHPILTVLPDGTFDWKESRELATGDWIVARKGDNIYGNNTLATNKSHAFALGALEADGYFGQPTQITFTNNQQELLDVVKALFIDNELNIREVPNKTSRNSRIVCGTHKAREFYAKYDIVKGVAKDKEVPQCILESDRETQLAFLSGYLECEMSIEVPKCAIEVISASKKLLEQVQFMLLNMGYVANLSEKKVKGYEDNWYGRLTLGAIDSDSLLKELTFITKQRQKQVEKFQEAFASRKRNPKGQTTPFGKEIVRLYKDTYPNPPKGMKKAFDFPKTISIDRLRELVELYPNGLPEYKAVLDNLLDPSFVYSQVVAIEDAGMQPTYDLHMPETHSFIANGMVNHNTEIASGLIQQLQPYLERGETIGFFTNSKQIFNQSAERISERLGMPVGKYGGGKKDLKQINVVMIPTINIALSGDPEAGLKLTEKERILKRIAKTIAPAFLKGFNQRLALGNYIKNFSVKKKVDGKVKEMLEEVFYSNGSDKQVKLAMQNFVTAYDNLLRSKNKAIFDKREEALKFMKSVTIMIVDEAHHSGSDTWYNSLLTCENAQYRMALTGSIDKSNKVLWRRMEALFGGITIKTSNKELIERGYSAKPTVKMIPIKAPTGLAHVDNYMEAYTKGIVENDYRNAMISKLTEAMYGQGKGVLLIVNWVDHGERLSQLLTNLNVPHEFIHGDMSDEDREKHLANMRQGNLKVMISTSIIDEGVDIAGIDVLVLCAGGKSLRQVLQRVGRVLRKKKTGDNVATVFDFTDTINTHLLNHSKARKKIYEEEAFDVEIIE